MAKTKPNEREFTGQVIAWIKERLAQGGLPFMNATNDSGLYGLERVLFPDVLVTLDIEGLEPFCGWELKTPTTSVRDAALLKKAVEKAQRLEAKYFVTWNMQSAVIWRTPDATRTTVTEDYRVREFGPDARIARVEDIRDGEKIEVLKETCWRLLVDLGRLHEDEQINLPVADRTFFVAMVAGVSERLAVCLLRDINKSRADRKFDKRLNAWAKKQGIEKYDQSYYVTLAQQVGYKLIGKILFYLTLRRSNLELPRMELKRDNRKAAMRYMRHLFQLALEVDYQAVFEADITDEIELSWETGDVLVELTENLAHWSFELMPLDVIGNVFERLVPEDARHTLGQYFTPDDLVDLIVSFCIREADARVMDPTCGTGAFLIRAYDRLRCLGSRRRAHHRLLEQVWGFDIAGFPAELATINLYRQDLSDYRNFPRVLQKDFFDVQPGMEFDFPPPKRTARKGGRVKVRIPEFDALVGNFPFIRQELIEKAEKGYKARLERVLFDRWGREYPALFEGRGANGAAEHRLRLSGQADIYAYLFFHAAAHLKEGARMGFVTSNSWLDVAYGYELQRFFLAKFKIVAICESRCEPWFEQSSVNTVFTVLERCESKAEREGNDVRFVKIKRALRELFPYDALADAQRRWMAFDGFVDRIEGMAGDTLCRAIESEYVRQPGIRGWDDDGARVRVVRQGDLEAQLADAGETVKWGVYLRAPDVYFTILEKCTGKVVPLRNVADIRRGITTGINEFFYLRDEDVRHWRIEERFVRPVVTSTKEIPGLSVKGENLDYRVFLCGASKKELRGTGALKYIEWAEKHHPEWVKCPSVCNRGSWWSLPEREPNDFLLLRFRDKRHYTPANPEGHAIGDVVFVGSFREQEVKEVGCAFLNSVITALFAEVLGRANLGDGLLTTYGPEIGGLLLPTRKLLRSKGKAKEEVVKQFQRLARRDVLPIAEEVRRKDRKDFECAVLQLLGLGVDMYEQVCDAVVGLAKERCLLPRMRQARRKRRVQQDMALLRDEITQEVIGSGVVRFPDGFVKGWGGGGWEEVAIPVEGLLRLGEGGMCVQEISDEAGEHVMEVGTEVEGKYLVYAKKRGEQLVRVPKKRVVLRKAVQDYEVYVREIRDRLVMAFVEKCGDRKVSENMAREVMVEAGLPDLR